MNNDLKKSHMGGGFELDTLDHIKTALQKRHKETSRDNHIPDELPAKKPNGRRSFNYKMISICVTGLLLISVGLVYFQKQELAFSFLSDTPNNSSKNYLRVGPVSTTLSNNSVIRFSMDIGLVNESSREKLAEKEAFVKNQIISTISKQGTAKLFETRQYDLIKAQIQENLEKSTGVTVSDVYFSDLRIF